jgi:ATP-dependent exoDNAse (exonuclease V) beta subunit
VLLAAAGREGGRGAWAALEEAAGGAAATEPAPDGAAGGAAATGLAPNGAAGAAPTTWLAALPAGERARLVRFAELFAAERARSERLAVEVLLERAIVATGYDLAILARAGGERRLANLRKLMRLAREYERSEGRDLRGFLAYAATQDLAQAREGEAALESEGLDAVRLMTIHRAKGLEFPVVCVADLGRQGAGGRERLLVGRDGEVGLRLAALGGGDAVPALAYERLAAEEQRADAEEERRLFYVAMTRARERLILSGHTDCERWPEPRPGGPPLDWIARALTGGDPRAAFGPEAPDRVLERAWDGRAARLRCRLNAAATLDVVLPRTALAPVPRARAGGLGTALPAAPKVTPAPRTPRPAPQRLSYTSLEDYARCGYRFYLQRVLGLPREAPPPAPADADETPAAPRLDPRVRGTLVHLLLEGLDFARPVVPPPEEVAALAATQGAELTPAEAADIRALVGAFAASPLCGRLAPAARVRREAGFAFGLDAGGAGPLVNGFIDVLAIEHDGAALVVDYKSDRLDGADPQELVERDYATQRLVYALAALRDGAERVEVAHCFLEAPDRPVSATFERAEMPALAERLVGLARGVLDERYAVTATPHRELCADCPGRRALCSHPESRTLAPLTPPPAPSPAAAARHSAPAGSATAAGR